LNFKFKLISFIRTKPFGTCFVTQHLTYKCTPLNSFWQRSCEDGILENLSDFLKRFEPLKNSRKDSKWSLFQIL
jgi:hypothetical protein